MARLRAERLQVRTGTQVAQELEFSGGAFRQLSDVGGRVQQSPSYCPLQAEMTSRGRQAGKRARQVQGDVVHVQVFPPHARCRLQQPAEEGRLAMVPKRSKVVL